MSDTHHSRNLLELLEQIQLEKFWPALTNDLQITQISHFDFVQPKDLESIGMSKPAIRRLLDRLEKEKKPKLQQQPSTRQSKLYNSNISSVLQRSIKRSNSTASNQSANSASSNHQSVIIRSADIQICQDPRTGEDTVLGMGHFGVVKKALWSTNSQQKTVAVKFLHSQSGDTSDLINEISCMCGLNHENLIRLYGICLDFKQQANSRSSRISMVTELAVHGSLHNYLKKVRRNKNILPVKKLYSYVYQIACGMEYLESVKLIHRDLACRNILLASSDLVKICDFGMTRNVRNECDGAYTMTETHKIPCAWYPPESIRQKLFSSKSDVWMFGVTGWEVFTLCDQPWPNMNPIDILHAVENEYKHLPMPYLCSKNVYSLMQKCWSIEASERPSFQAIRSRIKQLKPVDMRAKDNFSQENKMEILKNDQITVIDGSAGRYWWKGQNQRTLLFGLFPRAILDPQRPVTTDDISLPLKNSFIHTGHMSATGSEKNWGNPATIDQIFLSNPLDPPDFIDDSIVDQIDEPGRRQPVEIVGNIFSKTNNQNNLINLIDIEDSNSSSNEQQQHQVYQDYSVSIDSFSSTKSLPQVQVNECAGLYMNENFREEQRVEPLIRLGMNGNNRPPRPPIYQPKSPQQKQETGQKCDTPGQVFRTYKEIEKSADVAQRRPIDVDEFLNKVMNDVINDFDNVKLKYSNSNNNRRLV